MVRPPTSGSLRRRIAVAIRFTVALALAATTFTAATPLRADEPRTTVTHRDHSSRAELSPWNQAVVAALSGADLHVPDTLQPGTSPPTWLHAWQRGLAYTWRTPATLRAVVPCDGIEPWLLTLDGTGANRGAPRRWRDLGCGDDDVGEVDSRVMARTRDGDHLIVANLRCRDGSNGPIVQSLRIAVRTDAMGTTRAITGLHLKQPTVAWPLRPTIVGGVVRKPLMFVGGAVVDLTFDPAAAATSDSLYLRNLPQPERYSSTATSPPQRRLVIAFTGDGAPSQVLFADAIEATDVEQSAATKRRPLERSMPPASRLRVLPLDLSNLQPIWLRDGGHEGDVWLALEVGEARDDGAIINAGVALWRAEAAGWRRGDAPLPRTSAEGRWSCDVAPTLDGLVCSFESAPLPAAHRFAPQVLTLPRAPLARSLSTTAPSATPSSSPSSTLPAPPPPQAPRAPPGPQPTPRR